MERVTRNGVIMCIMCIAVVVSLTAASMEEEEKECADQMAELAACIPFVSGDAKQPTKDCCDDANKLKIAKPKCLCVLIKESTDPNLGLPINTTLALQMPAACKIDAKISDCPTLLNLPADSADAKIFKMEGADSSSTKTPPSSDNSTTTTTTSPSSDRDSTKTSTLSSNNAPKTAISFIFFLIAGLAPISVIFV